MSRLDTAWLSFKLLLLILLVSCQSLPAPLGEVGEPSSNPLSLSASVGSTALGSFSFSNTGEGTLSYDIDTAAAWLHVRSGASGTLAPGARQSVLLEAECRDRPERLTGALTIRSTDPEVASRTLAVQLEYTAPPVAEIGELEPNPLPLTAQVGETATAEFSFSNIGEAELRYGVSSEESWLAVTSAASGTVAPGERQQVTLTASCPETPQELVGAVTVHVDDPQVSARALGVELSCTEPPVAVQHLKYVIIDHGIRVYDIDDGYRLVKSVAVPREHQMYRIRGVTAHADTQRLYISYWGNMRNKGYGYLMAFDLIADEMVWVNLYEPSIDNPDVTPDGTTIYMGCGMDCDWWNVIDAATGEVKDKFHVYQGPHNALVSPTGKRVYLESYFYDYLTVVETKTNTIINKVGPFSAAVRPFTVNGIETLTFVNIDFLSGFEVGDLVTGEKLYSVQVEGFPWEDPVLPITQSHGIALTPDEREIWVVDGHNRYLHVFDVTGVPEEAPEQIASIALEGLPKWINFSRNGRFAHVSSGEIVDAETREIVTRVEESRYFVQIDFAGEVPVQAYSRYGLGYVTEP
jgi:hypothetical protein